MAVSTEKTFSGPFEADGIVDSFPFDFRAISASDVSVLARDANGVDLPVERSSFTVTLAPIGGTVFFADPSFLNGYTLFVYSDPSFLQETQFENGSRWLAGPVNDTADRSAIRDLALRRWASQSIRGALGEDMQPLPASTFRKGRVLMFGADTGEIELKPEAEFAPGPPGPSNNTRTSLAALKDAPLSDKTSLYDGSLWTWTLGNYLGLSDDISIVKADSTSLSTGAWVRQRASAVVFAPPSGAARSQQSKSAETISALDFGAKGDGIADDTAAIQAGLDWLGARSGGTLYLPKVPGFYRTTSVLRIPSYVTLQGSSVPRYPFMAGNADSSALVADFSDADQWIVEAQTTSGGNPIGYNSYLGQVLPDGATFDCAVRDLVITSQNGSLTPFGGVRMQGCPGAVIDNVAINRVGIGALLNNNFGARVNVHCLVENYGVVLWDCNAAMVELYVTGTNPEDASVAADYVPAFMSALNGAMIPALKLTTEAHYNRKFGLIVGSSTSTATGNVITVQCIEKFSGGIFQYNTRATTILGPYMEGSAGEVGFGLVAAASRYLATGAHAFFSGSGVLFDHGAETVAEVYVTGIPFTGFGTAYSNALDSSRLTIRSISPDEFGPAVNQTNVFHLDFDGELKTPTFANSWTDTGDPYIEVRYYRARGGVIHLQGTLTPGTSGLPALTLPAGYRPYKRVWFGVRGGDVVIEPNGQVIPTTTEPSISLDGISFQQIG